jgi:uncharacterized protein (TIGR01777 family)
MEINKIVLAGGSGFLGDIIINHFKNTTTKVIVLTRGNNRKQNNIEYIHWDGKTIGNWATEIEGTDVLINLTGKSVDCRYNEKNKREIVESRVNATKVLGEAVSKLNTPPKTWMNAASATIYRYSEDKNMDEYSTEFGSGFSVDVCKQWEQSFNEINLPETRKIILRITMVLGKNGGVIPVLKKLSNFGLGGTMGSGKQYISWIHEQDFLSVMLHLIHNVQSNGVYNIAAPDPQPNKIFMKQMRSILNIKIGLPAYAWMLEIGAFFMRTETELVLKSRNVVSKRLEEENFEFKFSTLDKALKDLL